MPSQLRHRQIYQAIKEENETYGYPIRTLCKIGNVSRAAYYKWLHRAIPANEEKNERIAEAIEKIHTENIQIKITAEYGMIWNGTMA